MLLFDADNAFEAPEDVVFLRFRSPEAEDLGERGEVPPTLGVAVVGLVSCGMAVALGDISPTTNLGGD